MPSTYADGETAGVEASASPSTSPTLADPLTACTTQLTYWAGEILRGAPDQGGDYQHMGRRARPTKSCLPWSRTHGSSRACRPRGWKSRLASDASGWLPLELPPPAPGRETWYRSGTMSCMAMNLRLSDEETQALRDKADAEGRSMQEVARTAIAQYVTERPRRLRTAIQRVREEDAELLDRLSR